MVARRHIRGQGEFEPQYKISDCPFCREGLLSKEGEGPTAVYVCNRCQVRADSKDLKTQYDIEQAMIENQLYDPKEY